MNLRSHFEHPGWAHAPMRVDLTHAPYEKIELVPI